MTIQKFHDWLQFATATSGLLVALSELFRWPGSLTLTLGLVCASAALASYFTGKRTEATLERKIESIETEQGGRSLSTPQLQVLTEQLRAIAKPNKSLYLMGLQGNRESIRFANTLKRAFEEAGFAVDGVWEDGLIGGTGPGVLIRQAKREGHVGQAIQTALHGVGIDAHIVEMGNEAPNRVEVIVAYKP